ncbi:hypothetical protein NFJ02_22g50340 [Pycnococcus provasolii]
MAPSRSGQNAASKKAAFFSSIKNEKGDTIRWSLRHGGLTLTTRDDASLTPLMHAAMLGKRRAMGYLLEALHGIRSKQDRADALDAADDEGRTALHYAANKGHAAIVELLKEEGASLTAKDNRGKTARDVAVASGNRAVVEEIDRNDDDEEEEEEEEDEEMVGLSRREKRELLARRNGGLAARAAALTINDNKSGATSSSAAAAGGDNATSGAAPAADEKAPEPTTPEVRAALEKKQREVTIANAGTGSDGVPAGTVDPALWWCPLVNMLTIRSEGGLDGTKLGGVSRLASLLTLDISSCGLEVLPDEIGSLAMLKNFSCEGNKVVELPASIANLAKLESINIRRNGISDLSALVACEELSVLNASGNQIAALPDGFFDNKKRITIINLAENVLADLDGSIEKCAGSLTHLNVSNNKLEFAPLELSNLKKLKELQMGENPWKEPKLKKVTAGEGSKVKDILNIVSKTSARGGGKGGGGKKGKGKKGKGGGGGGGDSDSD